VAVCSGVTLHVGLAAAGLLLACDHWPMLAWVLAMVNLVVVLGRRYVVMPLVVSAA